MNVEKIKDVNTELAQQIDERIDPLVRETVTETRNYFLMKARILGSENDLSSMEFANYVINSIGNLSAHIIQALYECNDDSKSNPELRDDLEQSMIEVFKKSLHMHSLEIKHDKR